MRHEWIDPASAPVAECPPPPAELSRTTFARRLDALRRRALATVTGGDAELATLAGRESGESDDDAARMLAVGVLTDVVAREWHALEEIAAARGRLAAGTFGRCESCGAPIEARRLEAVPTARYCRTCQTGRET